MKLFNKRLLKNGYSEEQASEIEKLLRKYPYASSFVDKTCSVQDIKDIHKFFDGKDAPLISFVSNLEPEKRILIIRSYSKNEGPYARTPRVWSLIASIATDYDTDILNIVLQQIITEKPNNVLLNLVRTALDQNVNLNDLDYFKKGKQKIR